MPLIKGFSASAFEKNVRKMRKEGNPTQASVAAAYSTARRALAQAGKSETPAMRAAWKLAIQRGLHGTGKDRVYRVTFRVKRSGRVGHVNVRSHNLKGANLAAHRRLRAEYKTGYTIRNVRWVDL